MTDGHSSIWNNVFVTGSKSANWIVSPSGTFFNHTAIRHAPPLPWLILRYQSGMSTPWQLSGGGGWLICLSSSPSLSCLRSTTLLFPLISDFCLLQTTFEYLWWVNKGPLRWTRGPAGNETIKPLQCSASVRYVPGSVLVSTQWIIDAVTLIWVFPINQCSSCTTVLRLKGCQWVESS